MAGIAVHMMSVQDKLMTQINQIQVQTLICSGTDDKVTAVSGKINARLNMLTENIFSRI